MRKLLLFTCLYSGIALAQTIGITVFAPGFTSPVDIENAGDPRLFVVEQGGVIKILNADASVNPVAFLTLNPTTTVLTGSERGLLGLAFHPDYATNGYFYINYTRRPDGATVIARYTVSADPNVADASSATVLLVVAQPFANHNGGTVKFGPDGYLYIGMGDGGSGGDPGNRAQNINENLGKMLRIDVDSASPYAIPPTNPYAGAIPGNDEIWALGLRNPWKFSFDSATGDLWVADVGQSQVEEMNRVSSTEAGVNYGWKCYEGNNVFSTCTAPVTYTFPLAWYTHPATGGCSVTGGYVYNGATYPNFVGKYFFADYCLNRIGTVTSSGTIAYSSTFSGSNNFTTFGEDINSELYVASQQGTVYRVVDTSLSTGEAIRTGFSMYPNPAADEVFIRNNSETPLRKVQMFDITGKLLLERQLSDNEVNPVNTSMLQSGLYLVTIEDSSGAKFSSKLTIE